MRRCEFITVIDGLAVGSPLTPRGQPVMARAPTHHMIAV